MDEKFKVTMYQRTLENGTIAKVKISVELNDYNPKDHRDVLNYIVQSAFETSQEVDEEFSGKFMN